MDKKQRIWLLPLGGLVLLLIVLALDLSVGYSGALDLVIRGAALLAYATVFLSILSSNYVRELVRFFGQSYVKVHHYGTVAALAMMLIHPIAVALRSQSVGVFVPDISSWFKFWLFAGRPALYLFLLAALAGLLRSAWKKSWRPIHWLSYLAFWFVTVHALLIGANLQAVALRVIAMAMTAATVVVFVLKRRARPAPGRPAKR